MTEYLQQVEGWWDDSVEVTPDLTNKINDSIDIYSLKTEDFDNLISNIFELQKSLENFSDLLSQENDENWADDEKLAEEIKKANDKIQYFIEKNGANIWKNFDELNKDLASLLSEDRKISMYQESKKDTITAQSLKNGALKSNLRDRMKANWL